MTVSNGAIVSAATTSGQARINASGTLTINGGDVTVGTLTRNGALNLNDGTLSVIGGLLDAGSASTAFAVQGGAIGQQATLRLSSITTANLGPLSVGATRPGTVLISGGAVVSPQNVSFATANTGAGSITLSGANSSLSVSGAMNFGSVGSGVLTIGPGASATVGGALSLGSAGVINLNGGTLTVGTLSPGGGAVNFTAGAINIDPGTISLNATMLDTLLGSAHTLGVNQRLIEGSGSFGGNFIVQSPLIVAGGTLATAGSAGIIKNSSSIDLRSGAVSADSITNDAGKLITVSGTGALSATTSINNNGELLLNSNLVGVGAGSSVNNAGTIRGSGRIDGALVNFASGEVRVASSDRIEFTSTSANNSGLLNLLGGQLEFSGLLNNLSGGRITGRGMLQVGTLANSGSVTLSAGISDVYGGVNNSSGSKVIISGAGNATFYDNVTNSAGSEFRVSSGAVATFFGTVSGLSQFTGTGTTIFEGPASLGRISKSGTTTVGPAGSVIADSIRDNTLSIEGAAAIVAGGGTNSTSRVNSLVIDAGGRLDLADSALIVDYSSVSPLPAVRGYLAQGYNAGAWNGDGISSSAAASQANRALGFAEATDIGSPAAFLGQPIDATSVLVRYTIYGDSNLDGTVNIGDFAQLASNFNLPTNNWFKGDYNYDGTTAIGDFALLASNFNLTLTTELPRGSAVPEPVGASILFTAALKCHRRRRR